MSKLSVTPVAQDDAKQNAYMQEFARRIEATPPGMCPVSMQRRWPEAAPDSG